MKFDIQSFQTPLSVIANERNSTESIIFSDLLYNKFSTVKILNPSLIKLHIRKVTFKTI
jgi:hypothetical protein